jgi:hypothetical protein
MTRAASVVAVLVLSGCGSIHQFTTPQQPAMAIQLQPHTATYELLDSVQGKACRNMDELGKMEKWSAHLKGDEGWVGSRFLYEEAKYAALESVHADNLLYVRARAEINDNDVCVYVTGRAYRILTLKAPSPLAEGEANPMAPPPAPLPPPLPSPSK